MVLPGWNVSEPLQLALKLYEVGEALKNAPGEARSFIGRVKGFGRSLKALQQTLEGDFEHRFPTPHLDCLRLTLKECQDCVDRCEEFSKPFQGLTRDGNGGLTSAGQRLRLVWQEKKVAKLAAEIDSQVNAINLSLSIANYQEGRSRRGSTASSPSYGYNTPHRAGTASSLPPYSTSLPSRRGSEEQPIQRAKTPSDLLCMNIAPQESRSGSDLGTEKFNFPPEPDDGATETFQSPDSSPRAKRLSKPLADLPEWDEDTLRHLESRPGTQSEVAVGSPESPHLFGTPPGPSRIDYQAFNAPSSLSCRSSIAIRSGSNSRPDIQSYLDAAVPETIMENLKGVKLTYISKNTRFSYPVTRIVSCRDPRTKNRRIVLERPPKSTIQFLCFPQMGRAIPHSEHPEAYGAGNEYKVKFIDHFPLYSQKLYSSRRSSDTSFAASTPATTGSSAASIRSFSSVGSQLSNANDTDLHEEARRHEYDFDKEEDYRNFQELVMGNGLKLESEIPVQLVTLKRYGEGKPSRQSELQILRLWRLGRYQYLMFFCNLTSRKYKGYKMEYFYAVDSKSKTVVKLNVHLPGIIRRSSDSKSPLLINKHSVHGQPADAGLTMTTDMDDLRSLDFLTIEFSKAEGKTDFLREASFHGLEDAPTITSPAAWGTL